VPLPGEQVHLEELAWWQIFSPGGARNVWRYGGLLPQSRPDSYRELSGRGGTPAPCRMKWAPGCFCTRGCMLDLSFRYKVIEVCKNRDAIAGWPYGGRIFRV